MLRNSDLGEEIDFFLRRDLCDTSDIKTEETVNKDPMTESTSHLQLSHEDPATSESELPSSQVNGSNQSILGNLAGRVHEHNQIESGATEFESYEFVTSERENKGTQDLQSLQQKLPSISSLNLTEIIEETETSIIGEVLVPAKPAIPTSGSELRRPSPTSLATPLHKIPSHVFEQGNKLNEGETRTLPCQKIQNGVDSIQRGSNFVDKEGEIGFVSNDSIVAQRNEEPENECIGKVSISKMPAIATSSTDSELVERPSPSPLDIPLHKTHSNSTKRVVEEGTTSDNDKIVTSSAHSESASSQSGPLVTSQRKSYPHTEIRLTQTEAYIDKESEGHPINNHYFVDDELINLFQPVEEDGDGQIPTPSVSVVAAEHPATKDNLVVKVLGDLEESLKMPLKDIASSEVNSLRLLTALNFLSQIPLEDVTLSDGLKAIIDSLHQEFPTILCSFKQAFATTKKFVVLEEKEKSIKEELAHQNEVAITLVSKISKANNLMDEAQQKEAILKEQIIRLEKEIEDCEANLSSLQEEKKKCIAETIGCKKEFENVEKDKSQMVEDQRKARQELFEVDYKWSVLRSQFGHNRIAARNPS